MLEVNFHVGVNRSIKFCWDGLFEDIDCFFENFDLFIAEDWELKFVFAATWGLGFDHKDLLVVWVQIGRRLDVHAVNGIETYPKINSTDRKVDVSVICPVPDDSKIGDIKVASESWIAFCILDDVGDGEVPVN